MLIPSARILCVLIALLTTTGAAAADQFVMPDASAATRQVAITFDDLPAARVSFAPSVLEKPKTFRAHNLKLLRRLRKLGVPVAGFVTAGFAPEHWTDEDLRGLLEVWLKAGATIGNHTTRHSDYDHSEASEFFADIEDAQAILDELSSGPTATRLFRAPYLHRGLSSDARAQLNLYLRSHHYQVAPVTIDLQDWIFAEIYAWADSNDDKATKDATLAAYIRYLHRAIEHFALVSATIVGREVPHIALLHANALNYDNISSVIGAFQKLDFDFVDLESALRDPMYSEAPAASGSAIRSWQSRQRLPWTTPLDPTSFLGPLYDEYQNRK